MKNTLIGITIAFIIAACTVLPAKLQASPTALATPEPTTVPTIAPMPADVPSVCGLAPIEVPVLPEKIPGYMQIDPATGLHMTGTPIQIDISSWHLNITGKVDHPLSFTYDQLRCMPKVTASPQLVCERQFVDDAAWSGVSMKYLLDLAGIQPGATEVALISADGYVLNVSLDKMLTGNGFFAYELNGATLPVLHGFPLRAVFPVQTGYYWVKWLVGIEVK